MSKGNSAVDNDIMTAASRIRKTINNNGKSPIPKYSFQGNPKSKTKVPKYYSFVLTAFYLPGDKIMNQLERGEEISERDLPMLGSGTCMLDESWGENAVKNEIVTLMVDLSKQNELFFEDLELTYLQKLGNRKCYKKRSFSKHFQYNAAGLKTIGGKDANKVYIVVNKYGPASSSHNSTFADLLKSHEDKNKNNPEIFDHSDFSDEDSLSTLPSSSPLTYKQPPPKKRKKSNLDNDDISSIGSVKKLTPLEIISKLPSLSGYQTTSSHENLISVLMMLRHFNGFFNAVCQAIKVKGEDASEIEHLLAQIYMLVEDSSLHGMESTLTDLEMEVGIYSYDTCNVCYGKIITSLRNLKCDVWECFFLKTLSLNSSTEYYSMKGSFTKEEKDATCVLLDTDGATVADAINNANKSVMVPLHMVPHDVDQQIHQDGEKVWKRKFYSKIPSIMACGVSWVSRQKKIEASMHIAKSSLEGLRPTNSTSFTLTAATFSKGKQNITLVKNVNDDNWKFYSDGKLHEGILSDDLWNSINGDLENFHFVFGMYSDIDHIIQEPFAEAELEANGKFLKDRLIAKNSQNTAPEILEISSNKSEDEEDENQSIISSLDKHLKNIFGQEKLKKSIYGWARHILVQKRRQELGVNAQSKAEMIASFHMILSGNPGTGKTTIARCMAGILFDLGILKKPEIVEVQRDNLISDHIGGTETATEKLVKSSFGKILFVDEAYTLSTEEKSSKDYGKRALEVIMRYLTPSPNPKVQYPVVIFCGYQSDMKSLLKINSGYSRRIKVKFHLNDYTAEELWGILEMKLLASNMRYPYGLGPLIIKSFKSLSKEYVALNNASLADDLLKEIINAQESRLSFNATKSELTKLTTDDFNLGVEAFLERIQDEKVEVRHLMEKSTQMPEACEREVPEPREPEVLLHIKGVGIIPGSPRLKNNFAEYFHKSA